MPSLNPEEIEGWKVVLNTESELEAELIKAYLNDMGIEVQILSQRDHIIPANAFDAPLVHVLVEPEQYEKATELVREFRAQTKSGQAPPDKETES
ncbi:MAG: DUF2007 domain-containing protein [Chlorobiales bacterium]|jgi:hypothetical protein|nr:DUF2007 domain-containing protein [Chlorobiales bacterium]